MITPLLSEEQYMMNMVSHILISPVEDDESKATGPNKIPTTLSY